VVVALVAERVRVVRQLGMLEHQTLVGEEEVGLMMLVLLVVLVVLEQYSFISYLQELNCSLYILYIKIKEKIELNKNKYKNNIL
jgi:hypothetical protein